MKRAFCLAILLLVSAPAFAQQSETPAPRLDDAAIADGVYTNNFFGFSYRLPEGFHADPPLTGTLPGGMGIFRFFVAGRPAAPGVASASVTLTARFPAYTSREGAEQYLRKFKETFPYYRTPEPFPERSYAGQKFYVLTLRSADLPVPSSQATLFTAWRGYILGFEFSAPSDDALEALLASLDGLNFLGPDTPLPEVRVPPVSTYQPPSWTSGVEPGAGCPDLRTDVSGRRIPQRIRISSGVGEGMLRAKVPPQYPPLARQARIQGIVVLAAVIGCDGAMQSLRVVSGHPLLVPAAIDAVKQWRYRPYLLNGSPVEVETQITVNFVLSVPPPPPLSSGAQVPHLRSPDVGG